MASAFLQSYALFPFGALPAPSHLAEWGISRVSASFALAFSLSAPFLIASLLYNVALGVINKAMPPADGRLRGRAGHHMGRRRSAHAGHPGHPDILVGGVRRHARQSLGSAMSQEEESPGDKPYDATPRKTGAGPAKRARSSAPPISTPPVVYGGFPSVRGPSRALDHRDDGTVDADFPRGRGPSRPPDAGPGTDPRWRSR